MDYSQTKSFIDFYRLLIMLAIFIDCCQLLSMIIDLIDCPLPIVGCMRQTARLPQKGIPF